MTNAESSSAIVEEAMQNLIVLHSLGRSTALSELGALPAGAYRLETCQRSLWVFRVMDCYWTAKFNAPETVSGLTREGVQVFRGSEAYAFLLAVASGLESQMIGETEVFGQVRQAWKECRANGTTQAQALQSVFQQLFEDVKLIRTKYLRGLGASCYGSLCRRFLSAQRVAGPVLMVGAGAFAESLLPWLENFDLIVTNRSLEKAEALAPGRARPLELAFDRAAHLVLAVPGGNKKIEELVRMWREANPEGLIIDLGEPAVFPESSSYNLSLKDFYRIQHQEEQSRHMEIAKARRACAERTAEREEQTTVTLAHGWDDLWSYA